MTRSSEDRDKMTENGHFPMNNTTKDNNTSYNNTNSVLRPSTSFNSISPIPSPNSTNSISNGHASNNTVNNSNNKAHRCSASYVEWKNLRFLIMDAPCQNNVSLYAEMLKKKNVTNLVRACEPSYDSNYLIKEGVNVVDIPIKDGEAPSTKVLHQWLDFVDAQFPKKGISHSINGTTATLSSSSTTIPNKVRSSSSCSSLVCNNNVVAVHCVAGLGRAPLLVVIALIERGMDRYEAITLVRQKRRGALNAKQLKYIENYKPRNNTSCIIC